ncbi:MAG: hypothetical protein JW908_12750 [Anaerolineales bacterium]|nr:hypothetical protein [Anaerolineales bacterium]
MRNNILKYRIFAIILAFTLILSQMAVASPVSAGALHQSGAVEINTFYTHNWSLINSLYSCRDTGTGCWVAQNYHVSAWLMSSQSVMIESSWKDPVLSFWSKYMSAQQVNFVYVEVQVDGETTWDRIKYYGGTNKYWHQESVDLSAYSGKKIKVKFQYVPNVKFNSEDDSRRSSRSLNPYNWQLFYIQGVTVGPKS